MPDSLKILSHDPVGSDAWLLRLERPDWTWAAGQLVSLQGADPLDQRDYTIASGERDDTLDVIYRLIPHGILTPFLRGKQAGDRLTVQGPYGRFTLRDPSRPLLFCATGTGIAPCRAYVRSVPNLNLTLLHGVRSPTDLYFQSEWSGIRYLPCCSREPLDEKTERLTERLGTMALDPDTHVYLCGANEMIYEVQDLLAARGIPPEHMFQEPYYYRAYDA